MLEVAQDIRYEVLDLNSNGMHLCQTMALDDAEVALSDAYHRLQGDESIADPELSDRLKSTTLNNLGVVQCHKGDHRKALDHLDSAFALETRVGHISPTTTLNLCATYNALGQYDKATQYAVRCIESLHHTVSTNPKEDITVLWGAAWHNLGIAQINIGKITKDEEAVNIHKIFQNALTATKDLLGPSHAMTLAIHETYRSVRPKLKDFGAFKQHEPRMGMFPPLMAASGSVPPGSRGGVATPRERSRRPPPGLFVTMRNPDRTTYREPIPPEAYVTEKAIQTLQKQREREINTPRGVRHPSRRGARRLNSGVPLQGNLLRAGLLYSDPHPMLQAMKGRSSVSASSARERLLLEASAGSSRSPRKPSGPSSGRGGVRRSHNNMSAVNSSFGASGGGSGNGAGVGGGAYTSPRRLSELLAGDMWVELKDPLLGNDMPGTSPNSVSRGPLRPAYAQALYAIDTTSVANDRVVEPAAHAVLDHQAVQPAAEPLAIGAGTSPTKAKKDPSPPSDAPVVQQTRGFQPEPPKEPKPQQEPAPARAPQQGSPRPASGSNPSPGSGSERASSAVRALTDQLADESGNYPALMALRDVMHA